MTRKFLHLTLLLAGVALTMTSVAACGDDSTATAPLTGNPVSTTSMYASQPSSAASSSSAAPSTSSEAPSSPRQEAGRSLPATAPDTKTSVPENFPGPNGQPVSAKGKKYLAALKRQKVTFMGDTDNNIALTMAEYICSERRKGTDPTTVRAYVTAAAGPGTKDVAEANAKADKIIRAADANYC